MHWGAIGEQIPTILSLAAFTLLMVPIRVPSLSLTTGEEADFDREMKAHGVANLVAGAGGSVQVGGHPNIYTIYDKQYTIYIYKRF